ncbi:MAG: hypothetical protein SNI70_12465 [Rikenellaceae bacterium]
MARLKSESDKYVTIKESEYIEFIENKMLVEALKIAGVESLPMYNAAQRILKDDRVQIHAKPLCRRYSYNK